MVCFPYALQAKKWNLVCEGITPLLIDLLSGEKENFKLFLVLLNVFKTTKVAVIDSCQIYVDTEDIAHLLLGHTDIFSSLKKNK